MTKVVLDATLRDKLLDLTEPLELCDESGAVLGTVVPVIDYEAAERACPPLSDEELNRRNQGPSYTTAEVLAYLEKL